MDNAIIRVGCIFVQTNFLTGFEMDPDIPSRCG